MSDLRELLGDRYEATIDKAVQTAERYFDTANYTRPNEGVERCEYGCAVQLIERTIEHVTARILEAVLSDMLAQAWDEGLRAGQRHQEPCLLHDTAGEDVPGWEMAECTCEDLTNPYRKEIPHV